MKIVHTSDWHLGKYLYEHDLEKDHRAFLDWLVNYLNTNNIDILIIAGDVFDIAYPSSAALGFYYEAITRIVNTHCSNVIIIGGNHDSANQLNAPKQILKFLNVHVVGGTDGNMDNLIIPILNKTNNLEEILICAVPFLKDKDIRNSVPGESFDERKLAFQNGLVRFYQEIADKVDLMKTQNTSVIATGHLYTADAQMNVDERDMYIGGLQQMNSTQFSEVFDYIALGHVHRHQRVGKTEKIFYSGSPVPVSFSESNQDKYIIEIEIQQGKVINTKHIKIPFRHKLVRIKGDFEKVANQLKNYKSTYEVKDWAEVIIEENTFDPSLNHRIEELINSVENLEVLNYKYSFKKQLHNGETQENLVSLKDMKVKDVFSNLLDRNSLSDNLELKLAFDELFQSLQIDPQDL